MRRQGAALIHEEFEEKSNLPKSWAMEIWRTRPQPIAVALENPNEIVGMPGYSTQMVTRIA